MVDLVYQAYLVQQESRLLPDCRKAAMRLVCYWASSESDCEYPLDFLSICINFSFLHLNSFPRQSHKPFKVTSGLSGDIKVRISYLFNLSLSTSYLVERTIIFVLIVSSILPDGTKLNINVV